MTTCIKLKPAPITAYTFICQDCAREERRTTDALPEGWDHFISCGGPEAVRCPDCNEAIEQRKIAELHGRMDAAGSRMQVRADSTPPAFSIFLEKQPGGEYLVAMSPETVLMRWYPLGFFLTPSGARETARQLMKLADLAEKPGTIPARSGDSK